MIPVCMCNGLQISVDESGMFRAQVTEDLEVQAETLQDCKSQISKTQLVLLERQRKALKPVQALLLLETGDNERRRSLQLWEGEVVGVYPNRYYPTVLKVVKDGKKSHLAVHNDVIWMLGPGDPQRAQLVQYLQLVQECQHRLREYEAIIEAMKTSLRSFHIPRVDSAFQALDVDAQLLAFLEEVAEGGETDSL